MHPPVMAVNLNARVVNCIRVSASAHRVCKTIKLCQFKAFEWNHEVGFTEQTNDYQWRPGAPRVSFDICK